MANKYTVIGTSCSGKTTLVYSVIGKLRKEGYFIDGLVSTDRRHTFDKKKLDYLDEAQAYIILQQAFLETDASLRDDMKILLSDRSVVDYFAYMIYCIKNKESPFYIGIKKLVKEWAKTYKKLFYVKKLPYVDDGSRPGNEFRDNVDLVLVGLIKELELENLEEVPNENREKFVMDIIRKEEEV